MKKRIVMSAAIAVVAVGVLSAQLGSRPAGFTVHHSESMPLSFYYPSSWFAGEQDGNLLIVNRQSLLESSPMEAPEVGPGDAFLVIGILPSFFMEMMGIPLDDVSAILEVMFSQMVADSSGNIGNEHQEIINFQGRAVAAIAFDDASQAASGTFFISHEQDDVIIFAVAYGLRATLDAERRQMAQIVSSAEFTGDMTNLMQ